MLGYGNGQYGVGNAAMGGYGGQGGGLPGGAAAGNQLNTSLGNYLNPAFGGLSALAAGQVGQAGMAAQNGIPANVQMALGQLQGNMQGPQGTQGGLYGQLGGLGMAQMGQAGLMGAGFNQINGANGNYNSAYNNALQAQMGFLNNQQGRAMQQNSDAQFGRGQLGTSGGALQTQAMAQGFGLADAQAQQYAASQGLAAQGQALTQGNSMLNNAFGNYNNSANLSNNMYNNIYTQNSAQNPLYAPAVGDPAGAQMIAFVDMTKVWAALGGGGLSSPSQKEAAHVAAVGLTARQDGASSFLTLRVVLR